MNRDRLRQQVKLKVLSELNTEEEITENIMQLVDSYVKQLLLCAVVGQSEQLCGKPNCNRQKLDNSPLCSYHWDIANS